MFNGALSAGGIDAAHWPLLLARAVWLAGLLSTAGALLFAALEADLALTLRAGVRRLIVASLFVACAGWVVWVVLQAATIASATTPAAALAALAPVFCRTVFGHIAAAQLALLLLAWAMLRLRWRWGPAFCALGATALQVGHLHAWAMDGWSLLTGAVVLHLLAAAGWLGALLPLRLVVGAAPLADARAVVRRFSRRATVLVIVLAVTALYQGVQLIGGIPGLFGASYGWVAMTKAALFVVLLALAWRNRFSLTPALAAPDPAGARAALSRSILVETGVGVAVVLAASVLTALPPGMHGQPVWPFTLRPVLPVMFVGLAWLAVLALTALLAVGAVLLRRFRLPALALAVVLAAFAVPRLGAIMEPATPTSFYRSQTGFSAASIADGAALFAEHCARCHADDEKIRLAAADGDVFWMLSAGAGTMPGFAATLDEDQFWHLIDFLRARASAGVLPRRAPDVQLSCADGSAPSLSDLFGKPLRLIFRQPPAPDGVADGCAIADPDARTAFSIATGLKPGALPGTEVLIDAAGRLSAVRRAGGDNTARPAG